MKPLPLAAALVAVFSPVPARAEIPAPVKAMIEAALKGGNEAEIAAVVKYASLANPDDAEAIRAMADGWRAARDEARHKRIAEAGPLDLWSGKGELGASRSTGNSDVTGLFASLGLTREGLKWRHVLKAEADYQRSRGVTTKERFLVSYEPNYKFDDRLFAYGLAQYERDTSLGYDARYAASGGLGYSLARGPGLSIDVQGGPALRLTDFTAGGEEQSFGGRTALSARWAVTPTVALTQEASAYVETRSSTLIANTALETKLIDELKARISYNVQYESNPPAGADPLDTQSRVTLVYSF